mgnify:CR=1 FL=1
METNLFLHQYMIGDVELYEPEGIINENEMSPHLHFSFFLIFTL